MTLLLQQDLNQRTPGVSDFNCQSRTVRPVSLKAFSDTLTAAVSSDNQSNHDNTPGAQLVRTADDDKNESLNSFTMKDLKDCCTFPLDSLDLDRYVISLSRQELGLAPVSPHMPFDVSYHPKAQNSAAVKVLNRLADDMTHYANQCAVEKTPRIIGLLDHDIRRLVADSPNPSSPTGIPSSSGSPGGLELEQVLKSLNTLVGKLTALRDRDDAFVARALEHITSVVNQTLLFNNPDNPSSPDDVDKDRRIRFEFSLLRLCGQESTIWFSFVAACLLSSRQMHDLRKLNPFLTEKAVEHVEDCTVALLLRATRAGHINRCLASVRDLLTDLKRLYLRRNQSQAPIPLSGNSHGTKTTTRELEIEVATIRQKSERLAKQLLTKRQYMTSSQENSELFDYDPRFLVFEFSWNLLLRRKQVQMVQDFMSLHSDPLQRQSLVKQLLMGAGKTTVISPLLALMLADGKVAHIYIYIVHNTRPIALITLIALMNFL